MLLQYMYIQSKCSTEMIYQLYFMLHTLLSLLYLAVYVSMLMNYEWIELVRCQRHPISLPRLFLGFFRLFFPLELFLSFAMFDARPIDFYNIFISVLQRMNPVIRSPSLFTVSLSIDRTFLFIGLNPFCRFESTFTLVMVSIVVL